MPKSSRLSAAVFGLLGLVLVALPAWAFNDWISQTGAGALPWGTTERPERVKRLPRSLGLPDAGFTGRNSTDKPDDWEVAGPHDQDERHFLRYVDGQLVDAWVLRPHPIDPTPYELQGQEQWKGPVMGIRVDGWREVGDAKSWVVNGRTVMLWRSRASSAEVLSSRAVPDGRYTARRPTLLTADERLPTGTATLKGPLKAQAKPARERLSACLNDTEKPVYAEVHLAYDKLGRLARIKVDGDKPIYEAEQCMAAALLRLPAAPLMTGHFVLSRFR